jgi:Ala-tRNA(Pro) deacylase
MRGTSAVVIGPKFNFYIGFDSKSDAGRAAAALKHTGNQSPPGNQDKGGHMYAKRLKAFLDSRGVKYVTLRHSPAYTAAEVAASTHVTGRDFAKTLVVKIGSDLAMVVLPATCRLVLNDLREMLENPDVQLATEAEFLSRFPDCEVGAMPPFGNLYDMPVYVASSLSDEPEIAFNAGTHTEVLTSSLSKRLLPHWPGFPSERTA